MTEPGQHESGPDANEDRSAPLAHHFGSLRQQYDSARLGMWIFLVTEILFFGGLFCAYAVYRANRPEVFVVGHHFLDTPLGAANTVVLIFSSLTMALAVRAAQLGRRGALVGLLGVTLLCGLGFLGVKAHEYRQKWAHRMVPGQARIEKWFGGETAGEEVPVELLRGFEPDVSYVREHLEAAGYENLDEEGLAVQVENLRSFMGVYFSLTALHALHVVIGLGVIAWLLVGGLRGRFGPQRFTPVDLVGLYWHLVDMIWIYLFPLLYLIH